MQLFEDIDDFTILPRVSCDRRRSSCSLPFHPLLLVDGQTRRRNSFSFNRLHQEPLKLTVIKLDASTFDVEVAKKATVLELKQAVEVVFDHLPTNGLGAVSWSHVWGHFCLSYRGHKLVLDTEHISNYGIKDGDQLHFIRHVSINYNINKKRSNEEDLVTEQLRLIWSDDREKDGSKLKERYEDNTTDKKENQSQLQLEYDDEDDDDMGSVIIRHGGDDTRRVPRLLGCWVSYQRLSSPPRKPRLSTPRKKSSFMGSLKKFFKLRSNNNNKHNGNNNNNNNTQKKAWNKI